MSRWRRESTASRLDEERGLTGSGSRKLTRHHVDERGQDCRSWMSFMSSRSGSCVLEGDCLCLVRVVVVRWGVGFLSGLAVDHAFHSDRSWANFIGDMADSDRHGICAISMESRSDEFKGCDGGSVT